MVTARARPASEPSLLCTPPAPASEGHSPGKAVRVLGSLQPCHPPSRALHRGPPVAEPGQFLEGNWGWVRRGSWECAVKGADFELRGLLCFQSWAVLLSVRHGSQQEIDLKAAIFWYPPLIFFLHKLSQWASQYNKMYLPLKDALNITLGFPLTPLVTGQPTALVSKCKIICGETAMRRHRSRGKP